jgi:hypothetical protein
LPTTTSRTMLPRGSRNVCNIKIHPLLQCATALRNTSHAHSLRQGLSTSARKDQPSGCDTSCQPGTAGAARVTHVYAMEVCLDRLQIAGNSYGADPAMNTKSWLRVATRSRGVHLRSRNRMYAVASRK